MNELSGALDWFCDFDGTITERDMIAEIVKHFVPAQGLPLIEQVNRHELSVRDGVERMFGLLPSAQLPEIAAFACATARLRPGFAEFVQCCAQRQWPLTVVSGGFDFFVHPVLAPFAAHLKVICNQVDDSGPYLRVRWAVPCDPLCDGGCGLCKPTVLRQMKRPGYKQVVVGDGVTDRKAAQRADVVFARGRLQTELERLHVPYIPFSTFTDIVDRLNANE
ncbi:MAG: MtnX-like HAD-IB family phosphatase [Alicyclobacillus sp.]|nr:MtnX-like HAD-IB family phosphatase [Alicyclobacillus sp.]